MTVGSLIHDRIVEIMRFGQVCSSGDIARKLQGKTTNVTTHLSRLWRKGRILRTEREVSIRGPYTAYLYCVNPEGEYQKARYQFVKFVSEEERGPSRAETLLSLLRKHGPLYGRELEELISQQFGKTNLQARDFVSRSAKKLMTQGKILREGLHFGSVLTPFRHGFIYAAIDQSGEEGVKRTVEAIRARITDKQLGKNSLAAYNVVTKRSLTGRLIGFQDLASELNLNVTNAKYVLNRVLRIYPELKAVEIGPYKFVYNASAADPAKIQESRTNLERWYSTEGLRLWGLGEKFEKYASMAIEEAFKRGDLAPQMDWMTQQHRSQRTDPKSILDLLIRDVDGKSRAQFDRVLSVRFPGPNGLEVLLAFEMKHSPVTRRDIDIFLAKLAASKKFGTDNERGERVIRHHVVPIMVTTIHEPREVVKVGEKELSVGSYARGKGVHITLLSDVHTYLRKALGEKFETFTKWNPT